MKRRFLSRLIVATIFILLTGILLNRAIVLPRRERLHTALIQASYAGQERKALELLKQGADVNLRFDSQTRKPLPSPGFWSNVGAKLRGKASIADSRSVPLLALAATYSRKTLLSELLTRGANVNATDGMGSTPLMYAVDPNDRDILIDLLNAHADVNHQNQLGNTPLHLAVAQKNAVNCALLLEWGANPNLANAQGQTPLDDLAAIAADIHRQWLAAYIDALAAARQKPAAPATPAANGVLLPSHPSPQMITRQHQQLLNRLRALVTLLQSRGAATSRETQSLLTDSFQLDPHEAEEGLTPLAHH